ncbi:MAG TPA: GNAT family N-acetyltransferase [Magnetospirillaceae bacterium]|nr:GNAT family N-acetyltransferase [Magnetospirillaceae bacterium]
MTEPFIRPYHPSDASALWQVIGPAIRGGETYALPRDMAEADALSWWAAGDHQAFVHERGGEVLGSYFIRPNQLGGGSHVANAGYATRPDARGQGIARAMCDHSQEQAVAQGFRLMQFNFVIASNVGAVTLWERCGFSIAGTVPEAFAHPRLGYVDIHIMVKRLSS